MNLSQIANEFKAHFEAVETEAQKYLAEHIPGVLDVADKIENDPLVQAAISLVVPAGTKTMLVGLLKSVEAEVAKVEADATAAAEARAAAAAQAPADPAMGEQPAA
jgi:hypothetical protein